ncbi:zinc finger CCCH domain-containing protein 19-like [Argentina anserina]|uniref:zinc finger CCCH domain-containing protein 19-like n=1 Tax=Argentina anserina TaxID=57926 RepID=UPI00217672D2|nr:zinc finger CCCH domain-containing protein 19-like [Potentilla anserina]
MKKQAINNTDLTEVEDWCFVCKDGGSVRSCDYQGCTKVYHPKCVNRKNTFLKSDRRWVCDHHSCSLCRSRTDIGVSCLMCTYSVCVDCRKRGENSEFAAVRGREKEGLCEDCVELVRLAEANAGYDRDGDTLDFEDQNTFEFGFKECWEILKEKEGLGFDDVRDERSEMIDDEETTLKELLMRRQNKGKSNHVASFDSEEEPEGVVSSGSPRNAEENGMSEDDDDDDDITLKDRALKNHKKRKFLIPESDSEEMETHSEEGNSEDEDEDEDEEDEITLKDRLARRSHKKPKLVIPCYVKPFGCKEKEEEVHPSPTRNVFESCFASVVASNMKLVYLRRSLVEDLISNQPEKWERKVVGSFVRVENDPEDYFLGESSHQLTQVKGITRKQDGGEILLHLLAKDVPISSLSDCDFTEEECRELREKVETYQVRRPTLIEIEHKARLLQEDLIKDLIQREFDRLMTCIRGETNQRGWISKELSKYVELKEMMKEISEQGRLLQQVPQVIPEVMDMSEL